MPVVKAQSPRALKKESVVKTPQIFARPLLLLESGGIDVVVCRYKLIHRSVMWLQNHISHIVNVLRLLGLPKTKLTFCEVSCIRDYLDDAGKVAVVFLAI